VPGLGADCWDGEWAQCMGIWPWVGLYVGFRRAGGAAVHLQYDRACAYLSHQHSNLQVMLPGVSSEQLTQISVIFCFINNLLESVQLF
jgi:hypothetical protein